MGCWKVEGMHQPAALRDRLVADADIEPDLFKDDEKVQFEGIDCFVTMYRVSGVNYEP